LLAFAPLLAHFSTFAFCPSYQLAEPNARRLKALDKVVDGPADKRDTAGAPDGLEEGILFRRGAAASRFRFYRQDPPIGQHAQDIRAPDYTELDPACRRSRAEACATGSIAPGEYSASLKVGEARSEDDRLGQFNAAHA
jgi:hypothetical protein